MIQASPRKSLTLLLALPYPFLLAVYPILFLYNQNPGHAPPTTLAVSLAASLLLTCSLWFAARLWLRDAPLVEMHSTLILSSNMIKDNEVARILKKNGYLTIALDATWPGTMRAWHTDVQFPCRSG